MKKFLAGSLALLLSVALMACGGAKKEESVAETESGKVQTESSKAETESAKETEKATEGEKTEVQVFVAASLKNVMEDLGAQYEKENPSVKLVFQAFHAAHERDLAGADGFEIGGVIEVGGIGDDHNKGR